MEPAMLTPCALECSVKKYWHQPEGKQKMIIALITLIAMTLFVVVWTYIWTTRAEKKTS
jgi:type II secretory pathway component PulM